MANFIVSPNMSLVIPSVLAELGPAYAEDINGSLNTIDGHNHSPGSGVPITPAGLNISSDLTFLSNNLTSLRSARFTLYPTMGDFNPTASDLNCALDVGGDLYFIDGSGNQIQITKNGFVNSGAGSISGLSGFPNASASYNGSTGTFVWEQGIGQAANMDAATLIIRYPGSYPTPSGNYIALQAPAGLATGYALTLPLTLPGVNNSWMVSTTTGSESWITYDPTTLMISGGLLAVNPITPSQLAFDIDLASQIFTSTGTFLVPPGLTGLFISAAGGGGGGGGGDNSGNLSGGGGAGAVPSLIAVAVVPGETLTVTIGTGGPGGLGANSLGPGNAQPGTTGGSTTISGSSSGLLATFYGGLGGGSGIIGAGATDGAGAGSFFSKGGAVNFPGQNSLFAAGGSSSNSPYLSGGGGAGIGAGGNGVAQAILGTAGGISAGGAGGGGKIGTSSGVAGGDGGSGYAVIFYSKFS